MCTKVSLEHGSIIRGGMYTHMMVVSDVEQSEHFFLTHVMLRNQGTHLKIHLREVDSHELKKMHSPAPDRETLT